jgi:hypothetical protein
MEVAMTKSNPYFSQVSYSDERIYSLMAAITAVILILYGITGCSPVEWVVDRLEWPHDSAPEELTEYLIYKRSGVQIDLTPSSLEE